MAGPAYISQRAPHRPAGGSPGARRRPSVPRGRGRTGSSSPVPAIGVLTVERTSDAVVESVEILAESDDPLSSADLAGFAGALYAARARTALVGHGVGYTGLTRPARFTGSTVPAVPSSVRRHSLRPAPHPLRASHRGPAGMRGPSGLLPPSPSPCSMRRRRSRDGSTPSRPMPPWWGRWPSCCRADRLTGWRARRQDDRLTG